MTVRHLETLLQSYDSAFRCTQRGNSNVVAIMHNQEYTGYRINPGEIPLTTKVSGMTKVRGYRELTQLLERTHWLSHEQAVKLRNAQPNR